MDIFVGVVLVDSKDRIYLIKEQDKNRIGKERWNLPGGSVDGKESLLDASERELKEETGYSTNIDSLLGVYYCRKDNKKWLYVVFGAKISGKKKQSAVDPGIEEGRWFDKNQFMHMDSDELVHPDMQLVYSILTGGKGLSLESVKYINYDLQ